MDNELIYIDTYVLQQDMRIRMPKTVLENMNLERGKTYFDIYLNKKERLLILKPTEKEKEKEKDE